MMQYELYDIENKNLPIGIFETYEAAGEAIGLSADAVYYSIKRDSVMKGRYKAAKITRKECKYD